MTQLANEYSVKSWSAWAPGLENESTWQSWANNQLAVDVESDQVPALKFVKPMQRRRLSRLSKVALQLAHDCLSKLPESLIVDRTVFCSRHGEFNRNRLITESILKNEDVSPTAFSLSVHNAASGLYSLIHNDRTPSVSIAAGEDTLMSGLIEANLPIALGEAEQVLLVYYDEPLAGAYAKFDTGLTFPYGIAMLLGGTNYESTEQLTLQREPLNTKSTSTPNSSDDSNSEPQALAFLKFLLSEESSVEISGVKSSWLWSRG